MCRPILRIPTLAIHLDRSVNEGFKFNNELHLTPIISTACQFKNLLPNAEHHGLLIDEICKQIDCKDGNEVISADLCLYDVQPACLGGIKEEFIFSARLDNLFMSYCSIIVSISFQLLQFSACNLHSFPALVIL